MIKLLLIWLSLYPISLCSQVNNYVVSSSQTFEYLNDELLVYHSIMFEFGAGDLCPEYAYYSFVENNNNISLNITYSVIGVWPTFYCERLDTFVLQLPEGIYDLTVCVDIIDTDIETQIADTANYKCDFYPNSLLTIIDNKSLKDLVMLSPNPFNSVVYIETDNLNLLEVKVYDIYGSLLKVQKNNFSVIDLTTLPTGSYFLEVISDKGNVTKQMIKL